MDESDHDSSRANGAPGGLEKGSLKRGADVLGKLFKPLWTAVTAPGVLAEWILTGFVFVFGVLAIIMIIAAFLKEAPALSATDAEKRADQTFEFVKWLVQLGSGAMVVMLGYAAWNKIESKRALEEFRAEVNRSQIKARENLLRLTSLQKRQLLLGKIITDLDEPCIRHSLTSSQKSQLEEYIELCETLVKDFDADEVLTAYDHELAGHAYHYLAWHVSGKERETHENTAIDHYEKALEKYEHQSPGKVNCQTWPIHRKMGNAYAGLRDYLKACRKYEKMLENTKVLEQYPGEKVLLYLSLGHSYKGMEDYQEAACNFKHAMNETKLDKPEVSSLGTKKDQQIYTEACYELANTLTAFGQYDYAIRCYERALSCGKESGFSPDWLHLSYGDALRKRGKPKDYEEARNQYQKELDCNRDHKGEPHFRKGQSYVGESLLDLNPADTRKYLRDACEEFEFAESDGCRQSLLYAYWGYAWEASGKESKKPKSDRSEAIKKQQKASTQRPDNAQAEYDLAVCYAMNHEAGEALRYLEKAGRKCEAVYAWAQEMQSADFAGILRASEWQYRKPKITDQFNAITKKWENLLISGCDEDFT